MNEFNIKNGFVSNSNSKVVGSFTATTISATTYYNLPTSTDVFVTGGTYNSGTATFTNNTGGTFNVTGFSTGTTTGNGTANYLARWTGSTGLSNSVIQDNGTNVGINIAPNSLYKVYASTFTPSQMGASFQSYYIGVQGVGSIDNGIVYGVYGLAQDNGNPYVTSTYIGGKFLAGGGVGANYGLQIQDGTEGVNKVLISTSTSGTTNWSSLLSGLTGVYSSTVSATTFTGDGSGLTNVTATAAVPYGLINAISSGNFLI
jgi:hypothetical protein